MYRSITALLPLAILASAQNQVYTTTIGGVGATGSSCPNGETVYQDHDQYWCCPGSYIDSFTDDAYCCVGGNANTPAVTFSSCFPFCTDSATAAVTSIASLAKPTCKATVYLTDSDYNSKVSSAAASASVLATTTSGNGAAQTGTSSGQAAGAMVTSGPIMGAMMIAGGLLMVA